MSNDGKSTKLNDPTQLILVTDGPDMNPADKATKFAGRGSAADTALFLIDNDETTKAPSATGFVQVADLMGAFSLIRIVISGCDPSSMLVYR